MNKIKIDTFNKIPIYFDKSENQFIIEYEGKTYQDSDLKSLKIGLEKVSEHVFKGKFYVKCYDGINEFKANRKYIDKYTGKITIMGIEIDKYGMKKSEQYSLEKLYPITIYNTKIYEESKALISKGWNIIREGERKADQLVK